MRVIHIKQATLEESYDRNLEKQQYYESICKPFYSWMNQLSSDVSSRRIKNGSKHYLLLFAVSKQFVLVVVSYHLWNEKPFTGLW